MWVRDVDGTRLVIVASIFPSTSQQDRAALDAVLASIQIAGPAFDDWRPDAGLESSSAPA